MFPLFIGAGGGGNRYKFSLHEGEKTGPDVRYTTGAELDTELQAAVAGVEAKAKKFFTTYEKAYPKLDKLYGKLVAHYVKWRDTEG